MAEPIEVLGINVVRRLILLGSDELVPMVSLYDSDGDETEDPDQAAFCVGQMASGHWVRVEFCDFGPRPVQ